MTTPMLDQDLYLVPVESSNAEMAEAFSTDDPEVIECAEQERFRELGGVVIKGS
jgi:hypothetical protein